MARGDLPADGELHLGRVRLPPGRRIVPWDPADRPAAWVTREPVAQPGPVWSALSALHAQTGLVPVLLADEGPDVDFGYAAHCDLDEVGRLDPAQILAPRWEGWKAAAEEPPGDPDTPDDDPEPPFPGLAPSSASGLSDAERDGALGARPAARIALVPAARPADVLATVGWSTFDDPSYPEDIRNAVWIGAVLRSWEDRFGARLLTAGPGAEITLLVQRPPRTWAAAGQIAAEHSAFCDECAGRGLRLVPEIATAILGAPTWTFWWD